MMIWEIIETKKKIEPCNIINARKKEVRNKKEGEWKFLWQSASSMIVMAASS